MKHVLHFEPQTLRGMVQILWPERPDARDLCTPALGLLHAHIAPISLLHNRCN